MYVCLCTRMYVVWCFFVITQPNYSVIPTITSPSIHRQGILHHPPRPRSMHVHPFTFITPTKIHIRTLHTIPSIFHPSIPSLASLHTLACRAKTQPPLSHRHLFLKLIRFQTGGISIVCVNFSCVSRNCVCRICLSTTH